MAGSLKSALIAARYPAGVADAIMSSGFRIDASAGNSGRSDSTVAGLNSRSSRPHASMASAARMPGPPAFVSTAVRRDRGSDCTSNAIAISNSSSIDDARSTPVCAKSASTAVSLAASAPVWDDAARAPLRERPDLTTMIGFVFVTRPAISRKRAGLPKLSTYIRMTPTESSCSQSIEQIVATDVGLVSHRDELRDADAVLARVIEHAQAERARL